VDMVGAMMKGGQLAPRTIRNAYFTLHNVMAHAVVDGVIQANPCTLRIDRDELPPNKDKIAGWRRKAIYSRSEVLQLLSDPTIPQWRRVAYALLYLAGLRKGEVVARRFRDYSPELEPLGMLLVATSYSDRRKVEGPTKTGVEREVPVHRALA